MAEPRALPYRLEKIPFVILGNDAFALKNYMMKPFPQGNLTIEKRIYNYQHSRARRILENMVGILVNRWRVFHATMHLSPERATSVILSALILHNYLLKSPSNSTYCPPGLIDKEDDKATLLPDSWRSKHMAEEFRSIAPHYHGNNISNSSKYIREVSMDYFMNEGTVTMG